MTNKTETGIMAPEEIVATAIKENYTSWWDEEINEFEPIILENGWAIFLSGKIIRETEEAPSLDIYQITVIDQNNETVENHRLSAARIEHLFSI